MMKYIKKALRYVIPGTTVFNAGMLSLGGTMLVLISVPFAISIPLAITSFFLAVVIEGTVYGTNMTVAMQRLSNQKKYLKLALAQRELKKFQDEHGRLKLAFQDNPFLLDYFAQKRYLHQLEEQRSEFEDGKKAELEIEHVKRRLEWMETLFIKCLEKNTDAEDPDEIINSIAPLTNDKDCITSEQFATEVYYKTLYIKASMILVIGSGVCSALVSLASLQSSFLVIGVSVSLGSLVPIVGLAAVGYALMMYRTITDMIQNDTLNEWAKQIKAFWAQENKNGYDYLKMLGIIFVVGISIAATIATAGTWWYLAKAGGHLINKLPAIASAIIGILSWGCMIVPNLLFNTTNSLNSAKKIPGIVYGFIFGTAHDIAAAWREENIVQFINPFRIICKLFKAIVFIGHLISMAVASDRCPMMTPVESTVINTTNEFFVDTDYIAKHPEEHHHHDEKEGSTEHHCHGDGHDHHHNHSHHSHKEECAHQHDDHHHHHGTLFLDQIEKILNYINLAWDCLAKWAGDYLLRQHSDYKVLDAKKKIFKMKPLPTVKVLSPAWARYETKLTLLEQSQKYEEQEVTDKAQAFKDLASHPSLSVKNNVVAIAEKKPEKNLAEALNDAIKDEDNPPLSRHRNGFWHLSPPDSKQAINYLLVDESLNLKKLEC